MKKIWSILLLIPLIVFSSCQRVPPAPEEPVAGHALAEPIEISLLLHDPSQLAAIQETILCFEKEYPEIQIRLRTAEGKDYREYVRSCILDNTAVLFSFGSLDEVAYWEDSLLDFSSSALSREQKAAVNSLLMTAQLPNIPRHALPMTLNGYGIAYHREMLRTAAIDRRAFLTPEKMQQAAQSLLAYQKTTLSPDFQNLQALFYMQDPAAWPEVCSAEILAAGFASVPQAEQTPEDSPLETLLSLFWKQGGGTSLSPVESLLNKETLFAPVTTADLRKYSGYGALTTLDLLPIPTGSSVFLPVQVEGWWGISQEAGLLEQEAALQFLNWLYTEPTGKVCAAETLYWIPPYRSFELYDFPQGASRTVFQAYLEKTASAWPSMTEEKVRQIRNAFSLFLSGKLSLEDLEANIQSASNPPT
ncbi:MAG TPA: extracellular solute-binding protein [Firmicutes bacterium]|nr:extracellular solute-binding protein [Bacillota bacterium]